MNVMAALGYDPNGPFCGTVYVLIRDRKFIPGGRYLYASGRDLHQTQNCMLMRADDSREGWGDLARKATLSLMTGAGIGVDYSDVRPSGEIITRTGGQASGPISLMKIVNEVGRNVMQGGSRRSAIWAGLRWDHADVFNFIKLKNWTPEVRALKEIDFAFPAAMDMTNVSILLDDEFFRAYEDPTHPMQEWARGVYWAALRRMVKTGEPGFSVDVGVNAGETLRNACTEVTSADDSDVCNLGSINLGRIETLEEFKEVLRFATLFLLAGTVYSDLPYEEVYDIRTKNRRLGLGLMGVHEWLIKRGKRYEPDAELGTWLDEYEKSGDIAASWADVHGLSHPIKTRAIAPTGTIGIIGETTTGIEPIFAVAYKRRLRVASADGRDQVNYQYVVDPTARRLIGLGTNPRNIEDAYTLSFDVERRMGFQAWMQSYVDQGISSTINLPFPLTASADVKDFGRTLMKYLPRLRGVTVYPDGARGGQPLTVVPYEVAIQHEGVVFEESAERCIGGECGV